MIINEETDINGNVYHAVVVDKSISPWYTENIRKACNEKSIAFYSIAEKGHSSTKNSINYSLFFITFALKFNASL